MNHVCRECGANFSTFEHLQQHKKDQHEKKKGSSKTWLIIVAIAVVIVILAGAFYSKSDNGQYDEFAKCITDSGAKFYGAWWCPHCKDQKDMFGSSAKYLPYVECSTSDRQQVAECADAQITGYPTWEFANGERVGSPLSLQILATKTGCSLTDSAT